MGFLHRESEFTPVRRAETYRCSIYNFEFFFTHRQLQALAVVEREGLCQADHHFAHRGIALEKWAKFELFVSVFAVTLFSSFNSRYPLALVTYFASYRECGKMRAGPSCPFLDQRRNHSQPCA